MKVIRIHPAIVLLAILILALEVGCSHMPGGIAPSTTPIGNRPYRVVGRARGSDSYVLLFGILPIKGSNSVKEAVHSAIRAHGADALIEVTVETYTQFWILFTRNVIKVEGLAIRFDHTLR